MISFKVHKKELLHVVHMWCIVHVIPGLVHPLAVSYGDRNERLRNETNIKKVLH